MDSERTFAEKKTLQFVLESEREQYEDESISYAYAWKNDHHMIAVVVADQGTASDHLVIASYEGDNEVTARIGYGMGSVQELRDIASAIAQAANMQPIQFGGRAKR